MSYRLNVKRLDETIKSTKGGIIGMVKILGTSSSKYHYNVNKGSFDTDFLIMICDYLKVSPADFFDTLDDNLNTANVVDEQVPYIKTDSSDKIISELLAQRKYMAARFDELQETIKKLDI